MPHPAERRLIFEHIDEPGYTTDLPCYLAARGLRGVEEIGGAQTRGADRRGEEVRPARPRRRRLPLRRQVDAGRSQERQAHLPHRQCRRVRARHVQGPLHHPPGSAPAHRGDHDHLLGQPGEAGLHLHPRRVSTGRAHSRTGHRRGAGAAFCRPGHPRHRLFVRDLRAPRRRRLHLRRGDGPDRVARGQAPVSAHQAAVFSRPCSASTSARPSSTTWRRFAT